MKRLVLLCAVTADLVPAYGWNAQAATYENPVIFADFSDPDILRHGRYIGGSGDACCYLNKRQLMPPCRP